MKEIKLKIYSFDELSKEAQHAVCERERSKTDNWGTIGQEQNARERHDTLKGFCDALGLWFDVNYDHCYRFIKWGFKSYLNDDEICGKYLWRFLDKIYYGIRSPKYFSTNGYWTENGGYHYKYRHSKIQWVEQECPFTGVCYDNNILYPILEWYKKPDWKISLHDLIEKCFSEFLRSWREEDEYCMSDEYIGDMIANNWDDREYLEDGTEFNGDYEEYVEILGEAS